MHGEQHSQQLSPANALDCQQTERAESRKSLYCKDQDDELGSQALEHPFEASSNQPVKRKERRIDSNVDRQSSDYETVREPGTNLLKETEGQTLGSGINPSSISSQGQSTRYLELPQISRDVSTKIEGYSDVNCKKLEMNPIHTLEIREEQQPTHSSYGPRVNRYYSKSVSKSKQDNFQPGATISKFNVGSVYTSSLERKSLRSREGKKEKSMPSIMSLSKTVLRYRETGSPLMLQLDSLVEKISTVLEKRLTMYPFEVNLLTSFSSIRTTIKKYVGSLINVQYKDVHELASDMPPEKMTDYFMQYRPRSRLVNQQMINSQPQLALKKYRNCAYFGGIRDNNKQGYGLLLYFGKGASTFEGLFNNDEKVHGVEVRNEQIYIGRYSGGVKEDEGGMLLSKDRIYYGVFRKGLWVDQGIVLDDKTLSFYSEEIDALKSNNDDLFVGHLHSTKNSKYGFGVEIFGNGDTYLGNYQLSKPQGYGEYYWASGARYKGSFLAGQRHGTGSWSISGGDSYEGEYMNDKKCGQGVYSWKNGCKYKGQFENDLRHGYGQMNYLDGRVEKGSWVDGVQRGRKCFEVKNVPILNNHRETVKQGTTNAFRQARQLLKINRTVYKKTRVSKAMQVRLQSIAHEKKRNIEVDSQKKTLPVRRVYAEDSY